MTDTFATKQDIDARFALVDAHFAAVDARFDALERHMDMRFQQQELRFDAKLADLERHMTMRLGGIMVAGIGVMSAWSPTKTGNLLLSTAYGLLGMLTMGTAVAVGLRKPFALKLYVGWMVAYLAVNGAAELTSGISLLLVATWMVLFVSLFTPVGLYLRSEREPFAQQTLQAP